MKLGFEVLGCFAVCRRIGLAPLVNCQGEDGVRSAGLLVQVVGSHRSVTVSGLQQLCYICFCLDLNFPAQVQLSMSTLSRLAWPWMIS